MEGGMELQRDIRILRFMHYRMNSFLAMFSHILRFVFPLVRPVSGVKEEIKTMCGLKCSIFTSDCREKGTLLKIHGGAFSSPAAPYHKKNASLYAKAGYKVVMPDYPLLPFHHHPEALEKLIALAEDIPDLSVIEGDSAGGFLAIHTVSAMESKPDLMLIYPVVMPEEETESMRRYDSAPMWNSRNNRWMIRNYIKGRPSFSYNLSGVRRAFVEVAEYDPLHDEGIMIADELSMLGASVVISEPEGTVHGYDFLWRKPFVRRMIGRRIGWLCNESQE